MLKKSMFIYLAKSVLEMQINNWKFYEVLCRVKPLLTSKSILWALS